MAILVTGGAGFIGSNIVDRLIALGKKVIVVDNLSAGKKENINREAFFYKTDIKTESLREVFRNHRIEYVIHHAAQTDVQSSVKDTLGDLDNNIRGTVNILEKCREFGVEKIIYASSAAVYGAPRYLPVDEKHPVRPQSPYGISKLTPEYYIVTYHELYDLNYTILRYSNAYGPRQVPKGEGGVIAIFVDKMIKGEVPVIYGNGEQTRDFIQVGDIVEANIKALTGGDNQRYNISTNSYVSINTLYETLNKILKTAVKPVYKEVRKGDIVDSCLDNTRAREVLGWEPGYDLYSGLVETVQYYIRNTLDVLDLKDIRDIQDMQEIRKGAEDAASTLEEK